jgi:hypothetical protein
MESNRLTRKLARWAFILQEYDFNIVHKVDRVNRDVNGLNQNTISSDEDTTGAKWHGEVDLETIPKGHAFAYLCTLLGCSRMYLKATWVVGIPILRMSQRAMVPWTSIYIYLLWHIYMQVKFRWD